MNDNQTTVSQPSPDLRKLNRLVGTWQLSGDTQGTVTYDWLEGGFFLRQHFDFILFDHPVEGIEIIGHLRPFGQEPSPDIHARVYDATGNTLDYIYELENDTLTIWGGQKGSPAYYKGEFSPDSNTVSGGWVWPGGGYTSVMIRATERQQMPQTALTISQIAEAFSRHEFEQTYSYWLDTIRWNLIGDEQLNGKEQVLQSCRQSADYLASVTTRFRQFAVIADDTRVVIDSVADYVDAEHNKTTVASCDIYGFVGGKLVSITSYSVELS